MGNGRRGSWLPALFVVVAAAAGLAVGCGRNEPFDPDSVANARPLVRLFVTPVEPGGELHPTSYYNRRFRWSGTDADGFVTEFYISIRTDRDVPAPWATTTGTDTFMTFATDANGEAEATILLACRDNRGALSDTVIQYIPLRNSPPVINFEFGFDPLKGMQRDFDTAPGDTIYWNWGAMGFRLFALDPDGAATMDTFYRYTLADGEPAETYDQDDPRADPLANWVRVPFTPTEEIKEFGIQIKEAPASPQRTLTVSVRDEADADTRFTYSWQVRDPAGPVLYIPDNTSEATQDMYRAFLDGYLGAGNYDEYDFWFGFPDDAFVLLESLRKFELVMWTDGGAATPNIAAASASGGVLAQLLQPSDASIPRKLLLISKVLTGDQRKLSNAFLTGQLGISPSALPATALRYPSGQDALGLQAHLPAFTTSATVTNGGIGLRLEPSGLAEAIYQMEYCLCYGDPRRPQPPYDPLVGVRVPARTVDPLARVVGISLQLEKCDQTLVSAALAAVLEHELGVVSP